MLVTKKKYNDMKNSLELLVKETEKRNTDLLDKVNELIRVNNELSKKYDSAADQLRMKDFERRQDLYQTQEEKRAIQEKLDYQVSLRRIQIDEIKKEYKKKLERILKEIKEEKLRTLYPVLKRYDVIYHRANTLDDKSNDLGELRIISVDTEYIKCKKNDKEYTFNIDLLGRTLSFTPDSMSKNDPAIPEILYPEVEKIKDYNVDMAYWPPKELGGRHHR